MERSRGLGWAVTIIIAAFSCLLVVLTNSTQYLTADKRGGVATWSDKRQLSHKIRTVCLVSVDCYGSCTRTVCPRKSPVP